MYKPLGVHAELVVFKVNRIQLSHYHGCMMEAPAIRRLIMNRPKVFAEIVTFMRASLGTDPSCVATDYDIEEVCSSYVEFYLLLDSLFSFIYNINNQKSTIGEVHVLKERLELVHQKWLTMGLSFNLKVYFSRSCNRSDT